MNNNENKVTHYLIPANVRTRFEFFNGFGWKELILTMIIAAISYGINKILGFFNIHTMIKFILLIFPIAISIVITIETNGVSIKKDLRNMRNYSKKQKRYLYKYKSGNSK